MALGLGWLGPGCAPEVEELLVVTALPAEGRTAMGRAFVGWINGHPGAAVGPVRIRWIPLEPGDDAARIVRRTPPPDIVLGIGPVDLLRLARAGRLMPIERAAHPLWCVSRRAPIVLVRHAPGAAGAPPARKREPVAYDDFRHDPLSLAWARGELAAGPWAEGYTRLVRWSGDRRPVGRQPGAALAAFERGGAEIVPWVGDSPDPPGTERVAGPVARRPPEWIEGTAVVRGANNPALAQEFIRFLAERGAAASLPADAALAAHDPEISGLLAELLGATLVDAQDELRAAWDRLEAAGYPARAERWMTEPPPWPPASVDKLLKQGESGATLLETLTAQIVPDAELRNALLQSWLRAPRSVDGALLAELAAACDGRLVQEPRFRAWLRGEWTAWARQRYRRVARLAEPDR